MSFRTILKQIVGFLFPYTRLPKDPDADLKNHAGLDAEQPTKWNER